jgi:myo-inositol 2-dehydrogenase/D-chiro-inositol 1-dehydrogenase/scyllo-inositol 2-dehydrogenase (NAD+)
MVRRSVQSWRSLFMDAYRAEDEDFIHIIRDDQPPRITGQDGRMAVAVVDAGNRSIREKRPVALEPAAGGGP